MKKVKILIFKKSKKSNLAFLQNEPKQFCFKIYFKSVVSFDNSIEKVSLGFIWLILSFTKLSRIIFKKKKN